MDELDYIEGETALEMEIDELSEKLDAARARVEELERMVVWAVEKDCRLVNRHVWQVEAGYIECDGTPASILAAVAKAMKP